MIFYTLFGPGQKLEIHDDKLLLTKTGFLRFFSKQYLQCWELHHLSQFKITVPQYLFWGKVEWSSFDGTKGEFRFSTHPEMMKKIELYLQKKIIKNHQKQEGDPKAPTIHEKVSKKKKELFVA